MKNKFIPLLTLLLLFTSGNSWSQEFWLMIDNGDYKVRQIRENAEAYFSERSKGKGSGYKQYKRWEYNALRMMDENGKLKKDSHYLKELQRYTAHLLSAETKSGLTGNWQEMGPIDWNATTGWNPGVGRITAFSIDKQDENHIIVGAETGGIWKSVNGGANWTPLSDYFSNLDVYSTAIDPNNSNTYYFGSSNGRIYRSVDGGATWNPLAPVGLSWVNKIVVHPQDSNIIFASSQYSGLYRSDNGGLTWVGITTDINGYDIQFKPGDLNTVYASGSKVHKSINGGISFNEITGFSTGPKMLGVSADDPDKLYVLEASNSIFGGLYVSSDSGSSFQMLNHTGKNYFGYSTSANDNRGQAPRDMAIAVNPNNAQEVHIAGILTWRSLNGGLSFTNTSDWIPQNAANANKGYNHADVDLMEFNGNTLYTATDGGIFKAVNTTNLNSNYYTDITTGMGIRQFYKIGVSQSNPVIVSGGSQDNGTSFYTSADGWRDWLGADGMETFIDKNNSAVMYGTTQMGQMYKTTNNGLNYQGINAPGSGEGNWVTPFEQDPQIPNTIYVGYDRVYKSMDSGTTWSSISLPLGGDLDHLKIAPSDNSVMYAARENSLYKSIGTIVWPSIQGFTGNINSIAIHPTDSDKVAIATTSAEKVYVSLDGGVTWQSYLKNLPDFQALSLTWDDNGNDGLYVGMNYGIYYIDSTRQDWQVFNNNLPNVMINELEINYVENKLYAATYGRGLWVSPVYSESLSATQPDLLSSISIYPNPANESITISWKENAASVVRIFNSVGKLLLYKRDVFLHNQPQIDVSGLSSGVYFLRINNENGELTKKLIIK